MFKFCEKILQVNRTVERFRLRSTLNTLLKLFYCFFNSFDDLRWFHCVCVKRKLLWNWLCSSSPSSSRDFASVIRNIGKFGAKNYFTDHQTANTNYRFRDSVLVLKIHVVIWIPKNLSSILFQAIATRWEQCWCKQPTSSSFGTLKTVYTYLNCMINRLLYCGNNF